MSPRQSGGAEKNARTEAPAGGSDKSGSGILASTRQYAGKLLLAAATITGGAVSGDACSLDRKGNCVQKTDADCSREQLIFT